MKVAVVMSIKALVVISVGLRLWAFRIRVALVSSFIPPKTTEGREIGSFQRLKIAVDYPLKGAGSAKALRYAAGVLDTKRPLLVGLDAHLGISQA